MLQLLKITFIAFSLLFIANISHANTCANDLSECTPKNLCEIATVKSDGIFSWSNLSKAKKHVTLAKNLGMDCGVKNSRTCSENIKICTTSELCKKATVVSGSSKKWTNYNAVLKNNLSFDLVNVQGDGATIISGSAAKPNSGVRLLVDGKELEVAQSDSSGMFAILTTLTLKKKPLELKLEDIDDNAIKSIDTVYVITNKVGENKAPKIIIEKSSDIEKYYQEAKRRGLSCGVNTQDKKKSCVQKPKNCNDTQLCDMGVVHGAEAKTWDTTSKWIKHANEAKMRGLSCGVGVKTKTIVKIDTADKKTCLEEPKLCNVTDLCFLASTSTSTWSQNRFLKHHVTEAKKRGLSCGVGMKTEAKKVETKKITQKGCHLDAAQCDNEKLCLFSTKYGADPKEWSLNRYYAKHILEAKLRGLSCGVGVRTSLYIDKKLIAKKKCSQDARECNETQLCKMGVVLSSGKKVWNTYVGGVKYSNEAKKRGLSCGVASNNVSGKKYIDIKQLNASEICANATFISNQKTDWKVGKYLKFVKEAKRRGLSCGVGNKAKVKKIDTKKKCSQDAKSCVDTKLCSIATVYRSGIKKWNYNHYGVHINEAKKRGLSCGVKPTNTSKKTINKKVIYPKCGVNNKINCYGQLKYTDGSFYFGEIQPKNIRNGLGLLIFPNGNYWVGTWRNNDFLKGEKASAKRAFKYNGFNSLPLADRKNAQQILFNLGYYDSSIDGQFGRKTFIAGAKFLVNQKSHAFFKKTLMSKTGSTETYNSILNYGMLQSQKQESKSINKLFGTTNASFTTNDFSRLNTTQRKQLQYGLKKLGFYRSSIDGLYGAGTEKAVRLYAHSKGIKSGFPYSVYNKIITEVIVPSSFAVATKPKPKPKPKSKSKAESNAPLMDKATGQALGAALCTLFGGNAAGCIAGATGNTASNPYGSSTFSTKSSNSCISDVNCAYGSMCIKRVGRGGECMEKPAGAGRDFKPQECDYSTDCKIGSKCHSTYKICVKR